MAVGSETLVTGLSVPLIFDYVNHIRIRKNQNVIVRSISFRRTETIEAARIDIKCTSIDTHTPKTFSSNRIVSIINPNTGEVFDEPEALLSEIIRQNGGKQPPEWPNEVIRIRCDTPETDENGFLFGWAFGVDKPFFPAVDIAVEFVKGQGRPREMIFTVGLPRSYIFDVGDMLYAPPTQREQWDRQVKKLKRGVQLVKATPDTVSNRRKTDGTVEAEVWDFINGKPTNIRRLSMTQTQFADFLRTGDEPC